MLLSQIFYLFYKSMFLRVFEFNPSLYLTGYVLDQVHQAFHSPRLSFFYLNVDEERNLVSIVQAGGTRIILQALRAEFTEPNSVDELLLNMHKVLSSIHLHINLISS